MLRELHISNLAVISDARIELHPGLNCFTGATGAGKSLVIGALEVLLGLRSPAEMLRGGAEEGRVSGLFEVRDPNVLKMLAAATDTDVDAHGGEVLLTRQLYASGRTSVSLNGHPITVGMLRDVAEHLVDVHGQHDHQYLLKPGNQIDVLDHFAGLEDLGRRYRATYGRLQDVKRQLAGLEASRALRAQQLELFKFQADEIDNARLDAAEYEELKARASVLVNLEKLKKDAGAAHAALYEADGSILERLKMMAAVLGELSLLDQNVKPIAETVRDTTIQLEDASFDLGRYLDKLDLDPAELAEVNDRLNTIQRILNKYGDPMSATLDYRAEIGHKIAELERAGDDLSTLTDQIAPLTTDLKKLGSELTTRRKASSTKLALMAEKQFAELGMDKARLRIDVTSLTEPTPGGFDAIEFIVQTNPGLAPQPLRKIASGGELSRIMLALKGVLAAGDRVSVLVFDEIDANVGGRLGSVIGSKLRQLATLHQVLCITHLPQIACYGDRHLTVHKEVTGHQTRTSVRVVDGSERLEEIAEMIGGQRITDTTRAQAKELLEAAVTRPPASPQTPRPTRAPQRAAAARR